MTQVEFDKYMSELRAENYEKSKQLREELKQIENRRFDIRKQLDEVQALYKSVGNEIAQKHRELKELNEYYYERKKALIKAFPKAIGTTSNPDGKKRHEFYALRDSIINELQERLQDVPGIDTDNIRVNFTIEGDSVTFETLIPRTRQ